MPVDTLPQLLLLTVQLLLLLLSMQLLLSALLLLPQLSPLSALLLLLPLLLLSALLLLPQLSPLSALLQLLPLLLLPVLLSPPSPLASSTPRTRTRTTPSATATSTVPGKSQEILSLESPDLTLMDSGLIIMWLMGLDSAMSKQHQRHKVPEPLDTPF